MDKVQETVGTVQDGPAKIGPATEESGLQGIICNPEGIRLGREEAGWIHIFRTTRMETEQEIGETDLEEMIETSEVVLRGKGESTVIDTMADPEVEVLSWSGIEQEIMNERETSTDANDTMTPSF